MPSYDSAASDHSGISSWLVSERLHARKQSLESEEEAPAKMRLEIQPVSLVFFKRAKDSP